MLAAPFNRVANSSGPPAVNQSLAATGKRCGSRLHRRYRGFALVITLALMVLLTLLVVGLLSRVLAECDARERLAVSIEILECGTNPPRVKARVGLAQTRPKDAIKAVTYHQLEVEEGKDGACRIRVVFDV